MLGLTTAAVLLSRMTFVRCSRLWRIYSQRRADDEAVAGLHEAAADARGAAAVAAAITAAVGRGAPEVTWGADVALPAEASEAEGRADD